MIQIKQIGKTKIKLDNVVVAVEKNKKVMELLMTITLVVYLITLNFNKLAIYFEQPNIFTYEKLVRYICYLLWLGFIILNQIRKTSINYTNIILFVCTSLIFITTGERTFLLLVLFMFAYKEYEMKKMIKINALVIILVITSSLLFVCLGIYPNWEVVRSAEEIRYCLGYAYATFLSAEYLVLLSALFFLYRDKILYKVIILMQLVNMVFYYYTDSRTSFLLTTLLLCYIAVRKCCKPRKFYGDLEIIFQKNSCLLPMILLILSLTLPIAYSNENSIALKLDKALSGRLHYSSMALDTYEIKYFGTVIEWVGNGGSNFLEDIKGEYNYIDNGYLRNLYDAGIVLTTIFLLAFTLVIYNSRKDMDAVVVSVIVLIWLFIEPHMLKIEMNILLMMMIPPVIRDGELDKLFKKIYYKIREKL